MTSLAVKTKLAPIDFEAAEHAALDYARELASVTEAIEEPLGRVESLIHSQLTSRQSVVQSLLKYVSELGGKRLRPALVLLSAKAQGEINDESIRSATAVELVHTATLVHDDVLDNAAIRRHRPSLHCQSNVHDSILIGDWLFTQAYALANEGDSTIPGRWIASAAKEVCEGEIRQNLAIGSYSLSADDYFYMVGQKTGSLCAVSCALGAWSGGGEPLQCDAFQTFGWKLGTAFQVHDDCLDYWGDEKRLGKAVGGDFASGKITLPIIRLLEVASYSDRSLLLEALKLRDKPSFAIARKLLEQYQVEEYCRDQTFRLSQEAIECLRAACSSPERQYLERLAISAVKRGA